MGRNWSIAQKDFESESHAALMESLFTLGNGYLGIRGDYPLSDHIFEKGTYINGFYESGPISYGEKAFGYAENWQTIIPLPDAKSIIIELNGLQLFSTQGTFVKRERILDLKKSLIVWNIEWISPDQKLYSAEIQQIIPFSGQGALISHWSIHLPEGNMSQKISIKSLLTIENQLKEETDDPRLPGHFNSSSLKYSQIETSDGIEVLECSTNGSDLSAYSTISEDIKGLEKQSYKSAYDENNLCHMYSGYSGQSISITKYAVYSYGIKSEKETIINQLSKELEKVQTSGIEQILEDQSLYMEQFWSRSDIEIDGDEDAQLSIRFNLFQLLQSVGRDGKRSIAAKGLSGSGYEGHYFWDAETYILPFFIYNNPQIARSLLIYRISILDKARQRAELLNHKGILFPWRTINGEECSAYFPAGTAQYHINSDIALGLIKYLEVTGDTTILDDGGEVLLAETARFWADFGSHIEGKGFCLNGVTGPDEYTALVDNNYYTNLSVRENLKGAAYWLKDRASEEERNIWSDLSQSVYLPQEGTVTPQDDSFLSKEKWDFASTPKESYPLLLHYHPMNIYRKQVLKQADVIMAQAVYPKELSKKQRKLNFDYYEQITTRDSSLSACAQGINAFHLQYDDLAQEYFEETLHTDRKDLHGNVSHGLHTASMGGSYLMILKGFLGLDNHIGTIQFNPGLPSSLKSLTMSVIIYGKRIKVLLKTDSVTYEALDGDVLFFHKEEEVSIEKGKSIRFPLLPRKSEKFTHFRPKT